QGAELEAEEVVRIVSERVPEDSPVILEGGLVVQARSTQLRKAYREIDREAVVLRGSPGGFPGPAEVLEDESPETAVVGRAVSAELQEARGAQLDALAKVELEAQAVEQRSAEALGVAQPVQEVEEGEANVRGEGQGDGAKLRAETVLRDG